MKMVFESRDLIRDDVDYPSSEDNSKKDSNTEEAESETPPDDLNENGS